MSFKVGEKVRVISEERIKKFPVYEDFWGMQGWQTPKGLFFRRDMLQYCGKIFQITNAFLAPEGKRRYALDASPRCSWYFDDCCLEPLSHYVSIETFSSDNPDEEFYISFIHNALLENDVNVDYENEKVFNAIKTLSREFINSKDFLRESSPYLSVRQWVDDNLDKIIKTVEGVKINV